MGSKEAVPYRPIGMVTTMLNVIGFEVTHWYEDLVFVEHNAFLVQMGDRGEDVIVWFNVDSEPEKRSEILDSFKRQEPAFSFKVTNGGMYRLVADSEKEVLNIEFIS